MFLNIFNGLIVGLCLKLLSIGIARITILMGWDGALNAILVSESGKPTLIGANLGVSIILVSSLIAAGYHFLSKRELKKSMERRFSLRITLLVITASIFGIWSSGLDSLPSLNFLWMTSLLTPDTITTIEGYPINLLAGLTLCTYILYAQVLGKKRRSLSTSFHISALLGFILLSYNSASGFFLFWLIQSLSLLYLAIKMPTILEPKK